MNGKQRRQLRQLRYSEPQSQRRLSQRCRAPGHGPLPLYWLGSPRAKAIVRVASGYDAALAPVCRALVLLLALGPKRHLGRLAEHDSLVARRHAAAAVLASQDAEEAAPARSQDEDGTGLGGEQRCASGY